MNIIKTWFGGDSKRLFYTILFSAFIIRLGFVLALDSEKYYFSDTRHYDRAAVNILNGNGFGEQYNRAPLYPVLMSGIYALFGHSFVAVRLIEVLISLGIVALVYFIALCVFSKKIALFAAGISALFPHFILIPGILYSTNIFTFLLALCLYMLLKYEETSNLYLLVAGSFIAGLTALTIPSFFFILPFWLLWIVMKPREKMSLKISRTVIFVAVFSLTLVPWTVRNYNIYGRLTLVRPMPITVLPNLENIEIQKAEIANGFQTTAKYLKENPNGTEKDNIGNMFLHYLKNPLGATKYVLSELAHFYALYPDRMDTANPHYHAKIKKSDERFADSFQGKWGLLKLSSIVIMTPVFIFSIIGLFASHVFRRKQLLLLSTIVSVSIGYSMILAEVRYRIPVEPYILMFTAVGFVWIVEKVSLGKKYQSRVVEGAVSIPYAEVHEEPVPVDEEIVVNDTVI